MFPDNEPISISLLRAFSFLSVLACLCLPFLPWAEVSWGGRAVDFAPLLFWLGPVMPNDSPVVWRGMVFIGLCCSAGAALLLGAGIALLRPAYTQMLRLFEAGFWMLSLSALGIGVSTLLVPWAVPTIACFTAIVSGTAGGVLTGQYRRMCITVKNTPVS